MDPEAFTASLFKWDPRAVVAAAAAAPSRLLESVAPPPQQVAAFAVRPRDLGGLEELFQTYGIRYYTVAKIAELGFTVSTLLEMKEEELDEMMNNLSQIFRWELFVGERYGIKAAVRAERRRVEEQEESRRRHLHSGDTTNALDALSQEGLSEEPVQQDKEAAGSGGGGTWEVVAAGGERKKQQQRRKKCQRKVLDIEQDEENEDDENGGAGGRGACERQREHPFIVTEPGEVARGKKNGLDYLFHLYEQCRNFLIQVQNIAKDRGEKCPTKVTLTHHPHR